MPTQSGPNAPCGCPAGYPVRTGAGYSHTAPCRIVETFPSEESLCPETWRDETQVLVCWKPKDHEGRHSFDD
jgi:hypothetical protein